MDDLVFKNIPVEGFDPQSGFSDRVSNPTPSRSGAVVGVPEDEISVPVSDSRLSNPSVRSGNNDMSFSGDASRLSNPTPSRKPTSKADMEEQVPEADTLSVTDPFSRASNPTPTRRGSKAVSPIDTSFSEPEPEPVVSDSDDPYSRASNPTPTRRRGNSAAVPSPDTPVFGTMAGVDMSRASNPTPRRRTTTDNSDAQNSEPMNFVADEPFSRASNPTPTRRGSAAIVMPEEFTSSDETASLSFASVTDPYGAGRTEDSRASNPTPTRRLFGTDSAPTDDEYDDSSRLSNISPSSRK